MENKIWKKVLMVFAVMLVSASIAEANAAFNVVYTLPSNGSTHNSQTVTSWYTPIWYDVNITNCSLEVNNSIVAYNATPLVNNSANSIIHNYGMDGYFKTFINCTNGTSYNASGNVYFTINTRPPNTFSGIDCTVMNLVVIFSTLAIVVILALLAYGGSTNPALALIVVIPLLLVLVVAIMQLVNSIC
jgi:hypothetical protein